MPDEKQLEHIVQDEARRFKKEKGERVRANRESLDWLVRNLRGMSADDARKLARGAIIQDGAITEDDLPEVNKAKFALGDGWRAQLRVRHRKFCPCWRSGRPSGAWQARESLPRGCGHRQPSG